MAARHRGQPRPPAITLDPEGAHHGGLPTYPWLCAPAGLATRRQLSTLGLRKGGQEPAAQVRRGSRSRLYAYLYRVDLAKPKFRLTEAKLRAVWTAARSRQRCDKCTATGLGYIPPEGVCYDCRGYPRPDPDLRST